MRENRILAFTESVCPVCLAKIRARRIARREQVYLEKTCPEHGSFQTVIWRGDPAMDTWVRPKTPAYPSNPATQIEKGCPYDCGLCPDHRQQTCCVLLEVTQRCDLKCPVCFADSPRRECPDPGLDVIKGWYRKLLETGGPFNIQLSGGEPCLRDDLPEIIALGKSLGFQFFQLNTNGLRIGRDSGYLAALKSAGLSTVYLQFDGTRDEIYEQIRGRRLLEKKIAAIEQCANQNIGTVLVPTLIPGVNTEDIGNILDFGLKYMPVVRGVHFQPQSFFGRYPSAPDNDSRITIPEIIRAIDSQTGGRFPGECFLPPGGENALCSFHGNFVLMPDGRLEPLLRRKDEPACCCCQPEDGAQGATRSREFVAKNWTFPASGEEQPEMETPGLGEWDVFMARTRTHLFCISGMAFMDAWNLDLERLKDCYIHVMSPDGKLVPFCAYNLTNTRGEALYRNQPAR